MQISNNEDEYKSSKKSTFLFSPIDISIDDDAFHRSEAPRFTEWWYFDTVFDNGYSAQMSIRVLSIIKNRLVLIYQRLDIYKDGHLIKHNKKRFSLKKFDASNDLPLIKYNGKKVLEGYIDKTTGKWIYNLFFEIQDTSANLRFEGATKGWKGINPGGDRWAVILPLADVIGKIKVNNKEIDVKGTGYHDHNWDVRASVARINHGWFWGKINTKSYTITWATIFKTHDLGQPLLVVNMINGGYINVKPENISFIGDDLRLDHKKNIPNQFILQAKNGNVDLNFHMKVLDIHHVKMMLRMNYWRFHVLCDGYIKIDSKKESIKEMHIAEFLRFK
jgi:hypothetical protein